MSSTADGSTSGSFLDLPSESIERHKAVGLWYEQTTLRVRAHLRDASQGPAGTTDDAGCTHLNSLISDLAVAGLPGG